MYLRLTAFPVFISNRFILNFSIFKATFQEIREESPTLLQEFHLEYSISSMINIRLLILFAEEAGNDPTQQLSPLSPFSRRISTPALRSSINGVIVNHPKTLNVSMNNIVTPTRIELAFLGWKPNVLNRLDDGAIKAVCTGFEPVIPCVTGR